MITAQEARNNYSPSHQETMEYIYKRIKERSSEGAGDIWSNRPLTEVQIKELTDKGYTVEYSEVNQCHRIYWYPIK